MRIGPEISCNHQGSGKFLSARSILEAFCYCSVQFSSVTQSCLTLCEPMSCSTPGLPVQPNSRSPPKLMSIESVMPSSHLIFCYPLLLLPSIFPSIRVFSNESALCIRWPKYWNFSFNISPSNEHPGLMVDSLPDVGCCKMTQILSSRKVKAVHWRKSRF